jgi:two-component system chemotaxis response regulator CheY
MAQVGKPLTQDVYNKAGQLLVKAGDPLDSTVLDFGYVNDAEAVSGDAASVQRGDIGVAIADDTPLMLDILEKSLRSLGFKYILRLQDGEDALNGVRRYRPDLVFLDIDMPKLDGLSALKEIRKECPHLFVCMLSAHSSVQNVRAALAAGASGFLVKPFQQARLQSIVDQFFKQHCDA